MSVLVEGAAEVVTSAYVEVVSCSESVIGGGKACSGRAPAMPWWGRWEL
nr:hypothetical protein [Streptomyces regalis]